MRTLPTTLDPVKFIRGQTIVGTPPLVPEVRLHLANEATDLWEATESALKEIELPPPFWAFAWPGGQALARWCLDAPERVVGKRILDFGSGSALLAIAAMKAGAASAVAADNDPLAYVAAGLNAELNGVVIEPTLENVIGRKGDWDLVFAGDVCYERPMANRVLKWLRTLADAGRTVIVGDPGRAYLPEDGLEPVGRYVVPTSLDLEDSTERETVIYRMVGSESR